VGRDRQVQGPAAPGERIPGLLDGSGASDARENRGQGGVKYVDTQVDRPRVEPRICFAYTRIELAERLLS
jgi:hypothetical protein